MRLLLVMPTGLQVGYDEYFSSSPMGIETLAAHARNYADVSLADMRGRGHDVEAHADELLAQEPDIVGLSVNSAPHTKYSLALAAALKRRRDDLKIIVGGQQATFLPEEMLSPGNIGALVRGEGEFALCEILQRGGDWRGVAGVSWMNGGGICDEPDRPLIADMDTVLLPARDLLSDRRRYRMGAYRVEGIESSRGCPHHCSFCSIRNFHRGKWRPKSVERVMQEIDALLDRYTEPMVIYFADDNFSTDIRRVEALCRKIAERKSDVYFWCQARADQLAKHPEVVEWMGKAHFAAVLMGVETSNPRLLKNTRKGTTPQQVETAIKLLHDNDVGVWGTFTLGLPGESPDDTVASAKSISACKVDVVQITVATPIPGSDLYSAARAAGEILDSDWDSYDFTTPLMEGQLPKAEMDAVMHKAYLKVYLSPRFLFSLFSKRTNLHRLRRTALRVFFSWIWLLVKERFGNLLHRRRKPGKKLATSDKTQTEESVSVEIRAAK